MRYGDRREAAEFGDPDALLARFEPGPGRVSRLVLHPHLSFVPTAAADFDGVRASFTVGAAARIFTGDELRALRDDGLTNAERAAAYDEAINGILQARELRDDARRQAAAVEAELVDARARLDRVARQRAEADEAVNAARGRLAALEESAGTEGDLRHELEQAHASAAHDRVAAAERMLHERVERDRPADAQAEAVAIRGQIDAVLDSLQAAGAAGAADVEAAERDAESARRAVAAVERELALVLERVEPSGERRDVDHVLERLRERRALLSDDGASETTRLLRDLAQDAPEPILVLVEPALAPIPELLDAVVSVSELKRVVVVTENTDVLHAARTLDPAVGALRQPLETGGAPRQVLAQSDGNRT